MPNYEVQRPNFWNLALNMPTLLARDDWILFFTIPS